MSKALDIGMGFLTGGPVGAGMALLKDGQPGIGGAAAMGSRMLGKKPGNPSDPTDPSQDPSAPQATDPSNPFSLGVNTDLGYGPSAMQRRLGQS